MKKITISESSAIWLDHALLINDAYKGCDNFKDKTYYELKKELFHFHPPAKTASSISSIADADEDLLENLEGIKNQKDFQKRKRKKKLRSNSTQTNQLPLESKITPYLQKFSEICCLNKDYDYLSLEMLPRFWEEHHEFPKFKGANLTDKLQTFSFGKQSYLIPAHSQFFNNDVTKLNEILGELKRYDLIVMDPPWRNKYIRRLKKIKLELAYHMLDNCELKKMPIAQLVERSTLVAIWCTNAEQHQRAVLENFLPEWSLLLVHTVKWLKISTSGELIGNINDERKKQPYEMLYIACHKETDQEFSELKSIDFIASIPSVIHSHKPPLLPWLKEYLPRNARCLELFARYLQPNFTSIGLEVLKLMDERLYVRKDVV